MKTQFKVKCTVVAPKKTRVAGVESTSYLADFVIMGPNEQNSVDDKRLFSAYTGASLQLAYSEEGRFVIGTIYYLMMADDKVMFTLTNT